MTTLKNYLNNSIVSTQDDCANEAHNAINELYYKGQYEVTFNSPSWQGDVGTEPILRALMFLHDFGKFPL